MSYTTDTMAQQYSKDDIEGIPDEANLGLGCGTPAGFAELKEGHTVLDLGSGAGIDVFIVAKKIGPKGLAIGVDMTEEMIQKAKTSAAKLNITNVDFRLGEIENLPIESNSVDRVISNCVINLVPDKRKVFQEIYRVLKPGGKFIVSDIVGLGEIPEKIKKDMELWAGYVAGAIKKENYLSIIQESGFQNIQILSEKEYNYLKTKDYAMASVTISAEKRSTS